MNNVINKVVSGRDENSFQIVELAVLGHRDVITVNTDGHFIDMPQHILTRDEMYARIAEHGTVLQTDEYVDMKSGYEVIRGRVDVNGVVHSFMFMYDIPYACLLEAALFGLRH